MKLAQITNPALGELGSRDEISFFQGLLSTLVTAALIIAGVVFFFMLLIGGISYITSSGDKTALEAAQGRIRNAFVGLIITFSAFAIVKLLEGIFTIKILTIDIAGLIIS